MPECVYDNPSTMCREAWFNGILIASVSLALLDTKGNFQDQGDRNRKVRCLYYMRSLGPWKEGEIRGDPAALASNHAAT